MTDLQRTLKSTIETALSRWDVPSAGYGVLKDGQVLLCEGYGLRDIEHGSPADGNTVYMIASCTKAFTAALVSKLADEGLLDWDTPVISYMPELQFYDKQTTEQVTLRDLLCHRTGMPRHEWSWYRTAFTREEIVHNLRYLKPNAPFRSVWQYFNQGFLVAGCVIERVTGRPYSECLREYIFEPLGMDSSSVDKTSVISGTNAAVPYAYEDLMDLSGKVKPVDIYMSRAEKEGRSDEDPLTPAGMICSNTEDMLKWVRFQLDMGMAGGKQLISRDCMTETHTPQISRPYEDCITDIDSGAVTDPGYALGWETDIYRGIKHIHHAGNIDGFSSLVSLVPDLDLGFVLLVNRTGFEGRYGVEHMVIDTVLDRNDIDWTALYMERARKDADDLRKEIEEVVAPASDATCDTQLSFAEYCGTYLADGYENISINHEEEGLTLWFAGSELDLEYISRDHFKINSTDPDLRGRIPVSFITDDQQVIGLTIKLNFEPGAEHVTFYRR